MKTALNYNENGGDATVIGGTLTVTGTLEIAEGATVTGVVTAEVIDALTSTEAGKALSAKQGKELKTLVDAKIPTVSIIDTLVSIDATKVLSAKQGKALKDLIDAIPEQGVATLQANSTASDVAGLVVDFNALLGKLKVAGLMATE